MTLLGNIKRLVNTQLARRGHAVVREEAVPSFNRFVSLLRRAGLVPRTVIDIGVADGTPWLYAAFPDAKYHLVDPTRESLPHMKAWAEKLDAEIHHLALGDTEGERMIDVRDDLRSASLFEEIGPYHSAGKYLVPVRRFDAAIGPIARPALCKIDVQGAEALVLRGMGGRVHDLDAIVIETSLIATIRDAPEFAEVQQLMSGVGFSLFDIVDIKRRPLDQAVAQLDAVFVPAASPLRCDRRWTDRA
jgi:FkbM family methyltransferase